MDYFLSKSCIFTPPTKQVDTVFAKDIDNINSFVANDVFVRIRVVNNTKAILTLKKPISRDELSKREHETVIDNPREMREILLHMGLQRAVVIEKTRMTTNYTGITVCMDRVVGLGDFIELEKQDNRPPDVVRRELIECANGLGLKSADEVMEGYDILMLRKETGGSY